MLSGRSLKLMAGGMSVLVLALLAMLAVGFFSDTPAAPDSSQQVSTSKSPNTGETSSAPSGGPALHAAIAKADSEAVLVLLDGGADVNAKNRFGDPALHAAIDEGHTEILRILVEADANVDGKNAFGDPALHRAILKGNSEMVRVLVEAGADANATNAFGDSALSLAVHEGDGEVLRILAAAGGN